jgi:uncharacterized protein YgbK (DUF1537 family)
MAFLGCIADDFTGAADVANNLVRAGMRTVQVIGVPTASALGGLAGVDAIVVALKSRTTPPADAVAQSRAALAALQTAGCERFYFKYCSTFDSTPAGNIGPVAEALLSGLGVPFSIAAPAFPATGRTVVNGELFVNGVPLNESGMQYHPLTPMTDNNLVRWLGAQCRGNVGMIDYETLDRGVEAVRTQADHLIGAGVSLAVADTVDDRHLAVLGKAMTDSILVTGGSGLALGLPGPWRDAGLIGFQSDAAEIGTFGGATAVVSGSCSSRTREQVAAFSSVHPALALDPLAVAEDPAEAVEKALEWAGPKLGAHPVLIYSTDAPEAVAAAQSRLGTAEAGALVERVLAAISTGLVRAGVRRLIVAGGETSGAVVGALGVQLLRIGPQIDPGVPWTAARWDEAANADQPPVDLGLALKSGNFGEVDFFTRAFEVCA